MSSRPIIAIDIDDVVSDSLEATRLWANAKASIDLQPDHYQVDEDYWQYYNRIWLTHGAGEVLNYDEFLEELVEDQAHIPVLAGAAFAIVELMKTYDVVFVTARRPELKTSTQKWLNNTFGQEVQLFFSSNPFSPEKARTKGEICKELGAWLLIDDNADNCRSVIDNGLEAILFGTYGWQRNIPEQVIRCNDWPAVLEYLSAR